ncbi:uncharacterized protein [Antedon mediterranea]|uniref:uncharacterized protein isoform X2 n=1 Tax=Antedon mediterranea TaxID=105859 RepID=UPI003AF95274
MAEDTKCARCITQMAVIDCVNCAGGQEIGALPLCEECNKLIHQGFLQNHNVRSIAFKKSICKLSDQLKHFKLDKDYLQASLYEMKFIRTDISELEESKVLQIHKVITEAHQSLKSFEESLAKQVKDAAKEKVSSYAACEEAINNLMKQHDQITENVTAALKDEGALTDSIVNEFKEKMRKFDVKQFHQKYMTTSLPFTCKLALPIDFASSISLLKDDSKPPIDDQPAVEQPGDKLSMFVESRMDGRSVFWCSRDFSPEMTRKLDDMARKIREDLLLNSTNEIVIQEGLWCIARYEDNRWYRAKVEKTKMDKNTAVVRWLDYAHNSEVPFTSIKELKKEFQIIPIQAVKCCLFDDLTEDLPYDVRWNFTGVTKDKTLDCTVLKVNQNDGEVPTLLVDLILREDPGIDVKERLKNKIIEVDNKKKDPISCRDFRLLQQEAGDRSKPSTPEPHDDNRLSKQTTQEGTDELAGAGKQNKKKVSKGQEEKPKKGSRRSSPQLFQETENKDIENPKRAKKSDKTKKSKKEKKGLEENMQKNEGRKSATDEILNKPEQHKDRERASPQPSAWSDKREKDGGRISPHLSAWPDKREKDGGRTSPHLSAWPDKREKDKERASPSWPEKKEKDKERASPQIHAWPDKREKERSSHQMPAWPDKRENSAEDNANMNPNANIFVPRNSPPENSSHERKTRALHAPESHFRPVNPPSFADVLKNKQRPNSVAVYAKYPDGFDRGASDTGIWFSPKKDGNCDMQYYHPQVQQGITDINHQLQPCHPDELKTDTLLTLFGDGSKHQSQREESGQVEPMVVAEREFCKFANPDCFPKQQNFSKSTLEAFDVADSLCESGILIGEQDSGGVLKNIGGQLMSKVKLPSDFRGGHKSDTANEPQFSILKKTGRQSPVDINTKIVAGTIVDVEVVTDLKADGTFWAVMVRNEKQQAKYIAMLNELSLSSDILSPSDIHCGKLVAVNTEEGKWSRARIIKVNEEFIQVRLVDTGLIADVSHDHIKFLDGKFSVYPFQAMECTLARGNILEFSHHSSKIFHEKAFRKKLRAQVDAIDGVFVHVTLLLPNENAHENNLNVTIWSCELELRRANQQAHEDSKMSVVSTNNNVPMMHPMQGGHVSGQVPGIIPIGPNSAISMTGGSPISTMTDLANILPVQNSMALMISEAQTSPAMVGTIPSTMPIIHGLQQPMGFPLIPFITASAPFQEVQPTLEEEVEQEQDWPLVNNQLDDKQAEEKVSNNVAHPALVDKIKERKIRPKNFGQVRCYNCYELGHMANYCPKCPQRNKVFSRDPRKK